MKFPTVKFPAGIVFFAPCELYACKYLCSVVRVARVWKRKVVIVGRRRKTRTVWGLCCSVNATLWSERPKAWGTKLRGMKLCRLEHAGPSAASHESVDSWYIEMVLENGKDHLGNASSSLITLLAPLASREFHNLPSEHEHSLLIAALWRNRRWPVAYLVHCLPGSAALFLHHRFYSSYHALIYP